MAQKKVLMMLLCAGNCLIADETVIHCIDLGNLNQEQTEYFESVRSTLPQIKHTNEFNGAIDIGDFVQLLQNEYQIDIAIETGTFWGATAHFLSSCFDQAYTVEISNEYYRWAQLFLRDCSNVSSILGSSQLKLIDILPSLQSKKIFFYLDAHFAHDAPLLDELDAISQVQTRECAIMIDDIKVPDRPEIPYNVYNGNECCYSYIASKLSQISSDYDFYYIIPQNVTFRAKFLALPKSWTQSHNNICENLSSQLQN
jgi:hypothetical protein